MSQFGPQGYGPPPGHPQPGYGPPPGGFPPPPADGRPPGRRAIRIGIVLLVVSVVLGLALTLLAFLPLFGDNTPTRVAGPTPVQAEADDRFALYRLPGADGELACTVTGPGGETVGLDRVLGSETLTLNGTTYRTAFAFTAPADGTLTVDCTSTQVAVGPRINIFSSIALGFAGIFGGIVLFFLGVAILVVGLVQRSNARKATGLR